MIDIPAGPLTAGCNRWPPMYPHHVYASCVYAEAPERIEVPAFKASSQPVSHGEYDVCVDAGVCERPWRDQLPRGSMPYVDVSGAPIAVEWTDAATYCRWRHASLPTVLEWERLARGSTASLFPWGDSWPTCEA